MSKDHKIGAALTVIALVACATQAWAGDSIINTDPGRESTPSAFAYAGGSYYISTATGETQTVTLGKWSLAIPPWTEMGAKYQDTFVLPNVTVTGVTGSTAKLILPNGNPNPAGTVGNTDIPPGNNNSTLLQLYLAGTAAGATPTHAQMEAVWSQIQTGFYNFGGTNGITTTATPVSNTGQQRLAMLLRSDTKTPTAAKYVAVIKDLAGDVNGDFNVNFNDILGMLPALDQTPASFGYGKFTWRDGDMNGDGVVNFNDILAVLPNLDQGPYNPGGGSGFAAAASPSGGAVPEPSTLALFLAGAAFALLTGLRRLVR